MVFQDLCNGLKRGIWAMFHLPNFELKFKDTLRFLTLQIKVQFGSLKNVSLELSHTSLYTFPFHVRVHFHPFTFAQISTFCFLAKS
jgi:hypothetical protein